VQVAPATLSIEFENSAVRILQVRPSLEGNPAAGFEVLGVTSDPATVEVIGPESSLRGLNEAMTEPVSIANARNSIREVVNVGVADPSVRLRHSQTTSVTVQIGPGTSTRTVAVPITITNAESGVRARLLTTVASVQVRGTQAAIDAVTPDAVQARVNVAGLKEGDHDVGVQVQTRQGLTVQSIVPATVKLRISKP
jgi:YbbR domain-containing protein